MNCIFQLKNDYFLHICTLWMYNRGCCFGSRLLTAAEQTSKHSYKHKALLHFFLNVCAENSCSVMSVLCSNITLVYECNLRCLYPSTRFHHLFNETCVRGQCMGRQVGCFPGDTEVVLLGSTSMIKSWSSGSHVLTVLSFFFFCVAISWLLSIRGWQICPPSLIMTCPCNTSLVMWRLGGG